MTPTTISYSIPSVTSRRAGANIRLLVAALVVGILPMLLLIRTVKGFHGVHLTLLTSQSSIPTFRSTMSQQEEKNLRKTARELASLDPNNIPAGSHYLLEIDIKSIEQSFLSISYWVLAMKAAQKERFIEQKRNRQQRRRDGMYGRNWTPITTLQAAVSTGKRDHSSMVAAPQRQQLKRTTEGARSNTKRWTQQTIISTNNDNLNNTNQRWKNSKVIIYENNDINRASNMRETGNFSKN
jgi:hypothetical protein